jgi:hypothetical protein
MLFLHPPSATHLRKISNIPPPLTCAKYPISLRHSPAQKIQYLSATHLRKKSKISPTLTSAKYAVSVRHSPAQNIQYRSATHLRNIYAIAPSLTCAPHPSSTFLSSINIPILYDITASLCCGLMVQYVPLSTVSIYRSILCSCYINIRAVYACNTPQI